jgi:dipeptidase E
VKLLPTSAGIKNTSIHDALVDLLGKPIAESNAVYVMPSGAGTVWGLGRASTPLCELGWKSLGVLELTALPSIDQEHWVPVVRETDALLAGGGDATYLCYWMRRRIWITRSFRRIPWPARENGLPACRCRATRLTIRPPSR